MPETPVNNAYIILSSLHFVCNVCPLRNMVLIKKQNVFKFTVKFVWMNLINNIKEKQSRKTESMSSLCMFKVSSVIRIIVVFMYFNLQNKHFQVI